MAAKKTTLAKSMDEELTCALCLSRFRNPKMLPCLHSFCSECLQSLVAKSSRKGYVSCPKCRIKHAVPTGGFIHQFILANMVELLNIDEDSAGKEGEGSKIVCESGLDTKSASGRCVECQTYLCQQCMDQHKKMKVLSSHKTVTLDEIKAGVLQNIVVQKHMCLEHEGEELKLYCKSCREVICRDCTFDAHQGHEHVLTKNMKGELVQELQELLESTGKKDEELWKFLSDLDEYKAAKEENFECCEQEVNEYFDDYIRRIQKHRASLLGRLHQAQTQEGKVLEAKKEALVIVKARIDSAMALTKQLLSSDSATEIAIMSGQVSGQLRELQKIKHQCPPVRGWIFRKKTDLLKCDVIENHVVDLSDSHKSRPERISDSLGINCKISTEDGTCEIKRVDIHWKEGTSDIVFKIPRDRKTSRVHIYASLDGVMAKGAPNTIIFDRTDLNCLPDIFYHPVLCLEMVFLLYISRRDVPPELLKQRKTKTKEKCGDMMLLPHKLRFLNKSSRKVYMIL